MMKNNALQEIYKAVKGFLLCFFSTDLQVMSDEVRRILSNPEDAKKYKDAIRTMQKHREPKTIRFSDDSEITLIP